MSKEAYKSFEIRTAEHYFNQLVLQSFEDFKKNILSSKSAIICAVFVWHFHEWMWAQSSCEIKVNLGIKKCNEFKNYLYKECPSFLIVSEIANGSKHFNSDGKMINHTSLQHGFVGMTMPLESHLIIKTPDKIYFFVNELRACIQYWEDFMKDKI
ncbi:hypothetical protein [Nodosilinea sp. P-1105]|uniref:hypothetical protein n=1 Tax=Nodosilinea sp. P-1105 TaxID=2546229 RepID=UPI00146CE082|nr:hypothetical protein [Nodosilinea sp. P-1105]NMF83309.1 hypothetical protein [Nodosilinea sp. P-1105]